MTPFTLDDAETELRAAIDSGDRERIDAAGALVDKLDVPVVVPSLHSAALWYVSVGLRVFPLSPGSKIPFKGSSGLKDATVDVAQVNEWWTEHPDANIGLATGHTFDAVDIDGLEGQTYRAQHWDDIFGKIDTDSFAKVLTPRPGGMHIYVPATGDRNDTSIVPGVDYRGMGGYVLAPPSVIAPGTKDHPGTYRFLGAPNFTVIAEVA